MLRTSIYNAALIISLRHKNEHPTNSSITASDSKRNSTIICTFSGPMRRDDARNTLVYDQSSPRVHHPRRTLIPQHLHEQGRNRSRIRYLCKHLGQLQDQNLIHERMAICGVKSLRYDGLNGSTAVLIRKQDKVNPENSASQLEGIHEKAQTYTGFPEVHH